MAPTEEPTEVVSALVVEELATCMYYYYDVRGLSINIQ